MSTISSVSGNLLRELFASSASSGNGSGVQTSALTVPGIQSDQGHVSPFARLLATLQQLQQTDPAKYQQVTNAIATNLQTAAAAAQKAGDSKRADALNSLAADFTAASKSGQLPNIQDLAKAIGGHHHGHHGGGGAKDATSILTDAATDPLLVILKTLTDALPQAGLQTSAVSA